LDKINVNQFSSIAFNLQSDKAKVRHETMEGRNYLVVPCVMMTVGVHSGSMGALYYPEEELAKVPVIWNYKPVVVYHPQFNGASISACDQDVIEKQKIGILMNTRFEDGKLKSECWIEEEKTKLVDDRVLNSIELCLMMEVSTGLFTDNEQSEGEWNGEKYTAIARNYRPDHLAILPDQKGACSIQDGAGLLRNSAGQETAEGKLSKHYMMVINKLSHNDVYHQLNRLINPDEKNMVGGYVFDVWDKFFIFEDGDKTYHQEYEVENKEVKLIGTKQEATKQVRYLLADGSFVGNVEKPFRKENSFMDKLKVVNELISNAKTPWVEEDRDVLMGMSEAKLSVLQSAAKPVETPAPVVPATNEEPVKEVTVDEYISNAPTGIQDMLRAGLNSYTADKGKLIAVITANKRNLFSTEELNVKGMKELTALAELAREIPVGVANFAGMAEGASVNNAAVDDEPLLAPTMDFK
jgi:hypothetical protein